MWDQVYLPVGNSLALSAACGASRFWCCSSPWESLRLAAWKSGLLGLAAACIVAKAIYGMPVALVASSAAYGAAFGFLPIVWIVFWAVAALSADGRDRPVRDHQGLRRPDHPRSPAAGAADRLCIRGLPGGRGGFGTPVAVAAAMLTGLGFPPFQAAGIALIANTAPVAFGAIGVPLVTLAGVTNLPLWI